MTAWQKYVMIIQTVRRHDKSIKQKFYYIEKHLGEQNEE